MRKLSEARGDTAVFTFGRFNPPTTGHEKLIKALASQVVAGAKMYVYPSHSQNAKKDPLPHAKKIAYMKKMFPRYSKNIITSRARNVFEIAVELYNKGHKAIIMVVGSDRVDEFDRLLNTYNGENARHGFYGFDDIKVISAGERDPDAEGVTGMSASKMRAAAAENDFNQFKLGLPKGFREGEKLFADVRKFMGVNEENWTFEEIIRDAYIRGEIFNIGEEVSTMDNTQGKIVRKGTNYVVLETNDGLNKFWISDLIEAKKITKTKQAKGEVGDMKGTQPAKYYSKGAQGKEMSLATKKARARHFAKGDSRKPAPGDSAKTKPSQYTKKFKQMYGENTLAKDLNIDPKDVDKLKQLMIIYTRAMKIPSGSPKHKAFQREIERLRKELKMDESAWEKIKEQEKEPAKSDQAKKRDEFEKLQKAKRIAALQYRVAKDQETIAKMSQQNERSLTDAEKDKLKKLEKEVPMKSFKDLYGKDAKSVYYATLTKMAKSESYEIGKDYADHTKEIDPYSAPQNEKTTLRKDKKLSNLLIPKKGKAGVTKFMRRKNLQKLAADVQADIDEQPTHEITVGDYIFEQPGIIESVQYTWQKDYPWEIALNQNGIGTKADIPSKSHTSSPQDQIVSAAEQQTLDAADQREVNDIVAKQNNGDAVPITDFQGGQNPGTVTILAEGATQDMDNDMLELPHILDVSCQFQPVHDFIPQKSIKDSPFIIPKKFSKSD